MLTQATLENVDNTTAEISSLLLTLCITIKATEHLIRSNIARMSLLKVCNLFLRTKEEVEEGGLLGIKIASGVVAPRKTEVLRRNGGLAVPHALDLRRVDGQRAVGVEVLVFDDEVLTFTGDHPGNFGGKLGLLGFLGLRLLFLFGGHDGME